MATGRRAGVSTAKADILEAARELFGEVGYDRATVRAIATRAEVDVALVSYYFGNKMGLFREVMELPVNPVELFTEAFDGPREGVGERMVRTGMRLWESPDTSRAIRAVLLAAVNAGEDRPSAFGEVISYEILPVLCEKADVSVQTGRVMASTLFGLAFMRYLVRSPLYTEPSADELIATYGAAIQRLVDAEDA